MNLQYSTHFFACTYILCCNSMSAQTLSSNCFVVLPHGIFLEVHDKNTKECYNMDQLLDEHINKLSYIFNWCLYSALYSGSIILQQLKAIPQCTHQMKWVYCHYGCWSKVKPLGCTPVCLPLLLLPKLICVDVPSLSTFLFLIFGIHNFLLLPYTFLHLKA